MLAICERNIKKKKENIMKMIFSSIWRIIIGLLIIRATRWWRIVPLSLNQSKYTTAILLSASAAAGDHLLPRRARICHRTRALRGKLDRLCKWYSTKTNLPATRGTPIHHANLRTRNCLWNSDNPYQVTRLQSIIYERPFIREINIP